MEVFSKSSDLDLDFAGCTNLLGFELEETIALEMDLETSRKLPWMTLLLKMKTTSSKLTPKLVLDEASPKYSRPGQAVNGNHLTVEQY